MDEFDELVRRLKARDPRAMEEVYDRYGLGVYRMALRRVRDAAAAEDLTQETFLAVWTRIGSFDGTRGSLGAWIGSVVRNRAIDYLRSAQYRSAKGTAPWAERRVEGETARIDRVRLLEGPWRKLGARQREVLRLAHWLGMSQTEIAERIGRPLGTVKTWMRGAHQALRAALESADG